MITIRVNGETREISAETDVADLLRQFSLPEQRIAIELNGQVIRRAAWQDTSVNDGDRIEIVHFVGGG